MAGWRASRIATLLIAFAAPALAEQDVTITVHTVTRVMIESQLARLCGARPIRACTHFIGRQLSGECHRGPTGWKAHPRAQYGIKTFLSRTQSLIEDSHTLSHERDHIRDVNGDVAAHLESLRARSFEDADDCRDAMSQAIAGFSSVMDSILLHSNGARHRFPPKLVTSPPSRSRPRSEPCPSSSSYRSPLSRAAAGSPASRSRPADN